MERGTPQAAARYNELLGGKDGVIVPYEPAWSKAVCNLYIARLPDRESRMQRLSAAGIGTALHYPVPLHLQAAYAHQEYKKGGFPITERVAAEILSLPMFPQLTAAQQQGVAAHLSEKAVVASSAASQRHSGELSPTILAVT